MSKIRDAVNQYHENKKQSKRFHFGVSSLGEKCERKLWLKFRWTKDDQFSGRMLRLFRRGHLEELTIAEDLINAGFKVKNYGKDQAKVDFGSHLSSEVDGIITVEDDQLVLECKTHSDKSFKKLEKEGLEKAKPMHWVQCNVYCFGLGLSKFLYYAVNKNDDSIYTEIFNADYELAEKYIERGQRIATQDEIPPKITENPSWWECKFCDSYGFCHEGEEIKNKNCRTCAWSSALEDSTWWCEKHNGEIDEVTQLSGCSFFELHDHLKHD